MQSSENSCETILDSYENKENDSQILAETKPETDPIMGDLHFITLSNDKIFSVDDALENSSNLEMGCMRIRG